MIASPDRYLNLGLETFHIPVIFANSDIILRNALREGAYSAYPRQRPRTWWKIRFSTLEGKAVPERKDARDRAQATVDAAAVSVQTLPPMTAGDRSIVVRVAPETWEALKITAQGRALEA